MEPNLYRRDASVLILPFRYDDVVVGLSEDITSPTKTAPSPTNATPPIVVDDNQGDEVGEGRGLRGLVDRRLKVGSERKERDEEESTNPICFRL